MYISNEADDDNDADEENWWLRFEKKVEIVNIFRIQVKMSTFVQFQLKTDENNLNVNKKMTSFLGSNVLFKKMEFEQEVRV